MMDGGRMGRRMYAAAMALCGATAAAWLQRSVWTRGPSQEWRGRDVNGCGETGFVKKIVCFCSHASTMMMNVDSSRGRGGCSHTEAALQKVGSV